MTSTSQPIEEPDMGNQSDTTVGHEGGTSNSRRQILKAGAALATLPIMAATSATAQSADNQATTGAIVTDAKSEEFINGMADLMAHSTRTPILRWPNEYGMEYEEIFFPAMDGVTIEGWFIPAKTDKLLIFNHPMPCNRYGYPGHLEPWTNFGGFEVNFLPEYKILHDAGYNIITYDMRNHGRSGTGSGGVNGHGVLEYRDVIGSLRYAKSRPDTKDMKTALYSRCLGANSTIVGMHRHPEEFTYIKAMIALQPVSPAVFVQTAVENQKIANGVELFDAAFHKRTGYHLADVWLMEYAKSVTVPTLVSQVRRDFLTKQSNVQEIYDTISSKDKRLFWIEDTDKRFEGYNYFGRNPQLVLDWFAGHIDVA
nr:alpha/beta hydrolase [Rhizobium sp. BK060]